MMKINKSTRLVPMNQTHLEMVLTWRNQECIRKYMFQSSTISADQHRAWFRRSLDNPLKHAKIFYLNDVPCGFVQISIISNQVCEWGFYIGNQSAPKGAGTVMGYLTLNYIFDVLCLNRVDAEIIESNIRSISYHTKLGFHQMGPAETVDRGYGMIQVVSLTISKKKWHQSQKKIEQYIGGFGE